MADATALGHMGLMFGPLGAIIMLAGVAQNLGPQYSYQSPLVWALISWGIGLGFVFAGLFRARGGP